MDKKSLYLLAGFLTAFLMEKAGAEKFCDACVSKPDRCKFSVVHGLCLLCKDKNLEACKTQHVLAQQKQKEAIQALQALLKDNKHNLCWSFCNRITCSNETIGEMCKAKCNAILIDKCLAAYNRTVANRLSVEKDAEKEARASAIFDDTSAHGSGGNAQHGKIQTMGPESLNKPSATTPRPSATIPPPPSATTPPFLAIDPVVDPVPQVDELHPHAAEEQGASKND